MEKNKVYRFLSYAKINWFLHIGRLREDGYHDIISIMQLIDLYDIIDLYVSPKNYDEIQCNYPIPTGERSLLGRLFQLIRECNPRTKNMYFGLNIKKNIPPSSGLGGASSNAATILKNLNDILQMEYDKEKLINLSALLGSDIPFFTAGHPFAVIKGKGEKVTPLPHPPQRNLILVFPHIGVNTGWAYKEWDTYRRCKEPVSPIRLDDLIPNVYLNRIEDLIWNDFEAIVFRHYPELKLYKDILEQYGCARVFMTGSGSAIIGIVLDHKKANHFVEKAQNEGINAKLVSTITEYDRDVKVFTRGGDES